MNGLNAGLINYNEQKIDIKKKARKGTRIRDWKRMGKRDDLYASRHTGYEKTPNTCTILKEYHS